MSWRSAGSASSCRGWMPRRRCRVRSRTRATSSCPDMLWGHTLRSPHSHARIVSIDISRGACRCRACTPCSPTRTSPARRPTGSSSPTSPCSRSTASSTTASPSRSSPPSTRSRLAAPPAAIVVEYEPLAAGRRHGARDRAARAARRRSRPTGTATATTTAPNVVRHIVIRHGDPDAARRGERRGRLRDRQPGSGVPRAGVGARRARTAKAASTSTSRRSGCTSTARRSRRASACRSSAVRIHLAGVGGAFGGREDLSMQLHAALLALHTNRPVKIVYNREESFTGHVHRHPARIWASIARRATGSSSTCACASCSTAAPTRRARRPSPRTPRRSPSAPTRRRTR